jgi:hypothetical protein
MALLFNKRVRGLQEVSPPRMSFSSLIANTAVDYGSTLTLNSTAIATNPSTNSSAPGTISYQWYRNDVLISGQTSAILTQTNQIIGATFYCVATYTPTATSAPAINPTITSATITTTIKNYVVFTKQPSNSAVILNKSATFGCSAVVGGFKSMSGFNDSVGSPAEPGYFGDADYNAAIAQGFSDEDIRYYLENEYTGVIGADPASPIDMLRRLNDINFGNSRNRNLKYEWYVDGVLQKTTFGPVCATAPGFNGEGIYLDLTDYPTGSRVQIEFNVTQDSGIVHRIRIPDLGSVNGGVNSRFLTDGYVRETLPGTSTPWGTRYLLLEGGRLYGPVTSDTYGSGFLAVASEINQGSDQRLVIYDGGGGQLDDMILNINKGLFRTYVNYGTVSRQRTINGVTFNTRTPPRVKYFSTYTATSSTAKNSSVVCRVVQVNTSGELAGLPQPSNTVTWTTANAECVSWDDSRKPGAKVNVPTQSGLKPGPVSIWYGPWVFGTDTDTCYFSFDVEVRDIYPRAINSSTDSPFAALFQCRVRGQGGQSGDVINAFKIIEWRGNSRFENENNKQSLSFNRGSFNGEQVINYRSDGGILFSKVNSNAPGNTWNPPGSGRVCVDILFLAAKRISTGVDINSFLTVNSTKTDNVLEYGRRFDQYEEVY